MGGGRAKGPVGWAGGMGRWGWVLWYPEVPSSFLSEGDIITVFWSLPRDLDGC